MAFQHENITPAHLPTQFPRNRIIYQCLENLKHQAGRIFFKFNISDRLVSKKQDSFIFFLGRKKKLLKLLKNDIGQ